MQLVFNTIQTSITFVKRINMYALSPYLAKVYKWIDMLNIITRYFLSPIVLYRRQERCRVEQTCSQCPKPSVAICDISCMAIVIILTGSESNFPWGVATLLHLVNSLQIHIKGHGTARSDNSYLVFMALARINGGATTIDQNLGMRADIVNIFRYSIRTILTDSQLK